MSPWKAEREPFAWVYGRRGKDCSSQHLQLRANAGTEISMWTRWGGQETGLGKDCSFTLRRQKYLKKKSPSHTEK